MKYILVPIFVFCFFSFSVAQKKTDCYYDLDGLVQDDKGEPILGATIILEESLFGTVSKADGSFHIHKLCDKVYRVTVRFLGYGTVMLEVNPAQERNAVVFTLSPEQQLLQEVTIEEKNSSTEHSFNYKTLSSKDREASKGQSLGESLRNITGVNTIQSGPGVFKPVIHGVHSQRILILNNGIRQEGQQWGAEHAPEIDPFIASHIVVIKDATAIKYGTDALGGVILVNPAELPTEAGLGGELNMVGQSNGRSGTVSGMLEGGFKKKKGLGWRLQGTTKKAGDFHTPDYYLTNTGIAETNFSASLGYHQENIGWEVFYSHFGTELGVLKGSAISNLEDLRTAMQQSPPAYTDHFSYGIENPQQKVAHNLLKLTAHKHAGWGDIRLRYGFQHNHRQEFDLRRNDLNGIPSINLQLQTHTLDLEWEHINNGQLFGCVGINGMAQSNKNIPGTQRIPFIPSFDNLSGGLYAVEKLQWGLWQLDAGLRYDFRFYEVAGFNSQNVLYEDQMSFHNLSATIGAYRKLNHGQVFSSSLANAWRPPHVAELYSVGVHQSVAAIEYGLLLDPQNSEIRSFEEVDFQNEQAFKWVNTYSIKQRDWNLEATAYANYILHYIYLKPLGITKTIRGAYPSFNYTQTNALFLGADLEGHMALSEHLNVQGKASLLWASDVSNQDDLIYIPSNRYEAGVSWEESKWKIFSNLMLESKLSYVAKQHKAPRVISIDEIIDAIDTGEDIFTDGAKNFDYMPAPEGYLLWNAAFSFSIRTVQSKIDFRLGVQNMLNTTYREYTNRLRYYSDDLGRNFTVGIKYSF